MHSKKTLGLLITFVLVFTTFPMLFQPQMSTEALVKIDPNLLEQMENENGPFTVLVKVKWHPDLEPIKFNHDAVVAELKAEAAETQAPVITYLQQKRDAEILNTFWLCNYILVKADEDTIREVATFTTVEKVIMNFKITLPENEAFEYINSTEGSSTTWNIEKVRAPEVWEVLGITGEGIKFATTDTGIDITHQDLAGTLFTADPSDPKYPGGWIEFDANGNPVWSTPHDTDGHGTATYGLIVGGAKGPFGAVGMAPGAAGLGMHALTLPGGSGTWAQVLAGLQWVIDPYDEKGRRYPPARVSSHSWGATGYNCYLVEAVENMYWTGHICVASIGNSYEGSSGTPGNYYSVIGVGATDINDYVAGFSSGEWVYKTDYPCAMPGWWPEKWIKPEVSAPGLDCIVPYPGNQYVYWSGTSFSSPHVAGAAVLMLSGNPSLTPDDVKEALQDTSVWYNYYYPERPDTRYGWGRIDAYEAVMKVALPQGVRGYVTDAETGTPISKAKVYCPEADRSVYTDANGYYDMRLLPGTYTLTFSRFGYGEQTITGVEVIANQFTWLNVALPPVPTGYVAGHVYFEPTQIGIPGALVKVLDIPAPIEAETNADGYYTLAIPPGTYSLEASAYGFISHKRDGIVVYEGQTTIADFNLTQLPKVAVVGDYAGKITAFLKGKGYVVDAYDTISAVNPYVAEYSAIIVNVPGYTTSSDFMSFITKTDENGVGVVWHDQWVSYTGAYWLRYYLGWPPYRYTSFSSAIEHTYYRVTATDDDIIPGWPVGYKIIHDYKGYFKDHAYWKGIVDGYIPGIGMVKTVALAGKRWYGYDSDYVDSQGIVKVTRDAGNKWVLLSMHGNTPYTDVGYWHDDTKAVFINSINWVAKPHVGIAKFVIWDLKAEPEVTLWKYPVTVSVGIKNVGWVEGTDTLKMYVDTILEGTAPVTLAPGEYTYPSWTVSRFDVGTYKVTVKHLTTTFRVRAPIIELKAYEYCTDQPLAGADIYGYYRKYSTVGTPEPTWTFKYFGKTNADGRLVFDSPESVVDMHLFVYKPEKTALGYEYLLEKELYIDNDMAVTYTPHKDTEAVIISRPNARGLELFQHMGVTWLQRDKLPILWPFTSYKTTPTRIVVTPKTYIFRHMLNIIDPYGSWWYYFMAPDRIATLTGGQTYSYSFAGPIHGYVKSSQTDSSVKIDWNVWDNFGHQITGISLEEVSWLSSGTTSYIPVPIKPSMLEDVVAQVGESINYYPLITIYDAKRNIIASGYVQWYEKPAYTTVTQPVAYAILSFMSGPYGNPNARMYVTVITEK